MIRGSGGLSAIALYTLGMGTNSIPGETTDLILFNKNAAPHLNRPA